MKRFIYERKKKKFVRKSEKNDKKKKRIKFLTNLIWIIYREISLPSTKKKFLKKKKSQTYLIKSCKNIKTKM